MRAAVMRGVGAPHEVAELELHGPGPGQVRVRLAASGVCHSDLSILDGTIPYFTPCVLGHEGAGEVVELGAGVESVAVGDHVILSWVTPCRRCRFCLGGQTELCERGIDHAYAGPYATLDGEGVHPALGTATFGEETVVPAGAVVPIDPDFPLDQAALIGCGVVTGVGSVLRGARVRPGETVAVIGCGGVGLAAVQGARLAGAELIVAVDLVQGRLDEALHHGATHVVNGSTDEPVAAVRDLTGGGVDHSFEVVGRAQTIQQAFSMARRGGHVTVVGAGGLSDTVELPVMGLMADSRTVKGVVYGATDPHRDFPAMVRLAQRGLLDLERLITARIGLEGVDDAFAAMQRGEGVRSVIVYA